MPSSLTRRQLLAGMAAPGVDRLLAKSPWRGGTARVRITPDRSLWQAGYAARTRASEGTLHEIYVRALALDDGSGMPAVIVAGDLLGFPRDVADRIAGRASRDFGVRRDRLILNASHTHGGPVVGDTLRIAYHASPEQWKETFAYTRRLEDRVVECIGRSLSRMEPVRLNFTRRKAAFAANRRTPDGPVDHDVPVLFAFGAGGMKAIVFGYACHNTTLGGDEYRYHGDYAGYAQSYVEHRNPGSIAMYLAGCAGDANPSPRGRLGHAIDHGEALGKVVSDSLAVYDAPFAGPLKTALEYVTLEFAPVPDRAHWQAKLNDENQYVRRHAQLMLDTLDRKGRIPNRYSYPVQVWQFGDWLTLVSLAGEVVVDYALRLKKERNPSLGPGLTEPWVAAYSNDVSFYVPSLRVLKEGGYEGGGAMLYYGQPGPFIESVEETIIRKVHQLVRLTT